jgi:hypothetical protein
MKVKVSYLLASFIAILFALSVKAQDELPLLEIQDPSHREFNLDEDKTLIYDPNSHTNTSRDSIQSTPRVVPFVPLKTAKPDSHRNTAKEKEEADALSFNFIYYIIQKYKMSDLIDQ